MWVDRNSIDHFQAQVDQHGCVVLDQVPVQPGRLLTLSGAPQTSLVVARAYQGGYAVLVPEDVTPRVAELAPYFAQTEVQQGWRILNLPPCRSVEDALQYAGHVLGLQAAPPAPQAQPAHVAGADGPTTVRVASAQREAESVATGAALPYTRDLTEAARRSELAPLCGRERELDQVLVVLHQRVRNCPMLVGEPGTGKTAIAEGLARMAAEDRLPKRLRGLRVLALDLPALLAESGQKGGVEKNITRLMDAVERDPNLVLFCDEIHNLASARGDISILEMVKPRLARGLRLMGATTHAEYKQKIAGDQALVRRFDLITIEEPSPEETEAVLLARLPSLESHHGVSVSRELLSEIVRLADEYFPDRRRPDKALMLLDRTMAAEALKVSRTER